MGDATFRKQFKPSLPDECGGMALRARGQMKPMKLKELEDLLARARADGAADDTTVYLSSKRLKYMRDVDSVQVQKREGWPEKEWPVVISGKQ